MFNNFFFPRKSCRLWDNVEKYGAARQATDVTIRRIRVARWISKATRARTRVHTHKYVIIIAFPRQQWSRIRRSVTLYVHCLPCQYTNTVSESPHTQNAPHIIQEQDPRWIEDAIRCLCIKNYKIATHYVSNPRKCNDRYCLTVLKQYCKHYLYQLNRSYERYLTDISCKNTAIWHELLLYLSHLSKF